MPGRVAGRVVRAVAVTAGVLALVLPPGGGAPATPRGPAAVLPVDGPVVRGFDPPSTPYGAGHRGVDLGALPGTPIRAALGGTVTFAGAVAGRGWVTVDHGGDLDTTYGPVKPRRVHAGDRVRAGQVLGFIGPGQAHLDWGARLRGSYIDPLTLLGRWRPHLVPVGS